MLEKSPISSQYMVEALKKLLRPVIHLLISKGITYPVLNELVKEVYVEIADSDFKLPGKQQTDSRINFLTGIHRKDVKRLRSQGKDDEFQSETTSLSALLLSRWLADPAYVDEQRKPLALPRLKKKGGEISFEGLVVSVNKDIRSRAILDEWLNMNIVFQDENDFIHINQKVFIPQQGYEEKVWFFGENLHDHLAAAVSNLKGESPPFLERAVYYDQLTSTSVTELAALSEKLGMKVLLEINSQALALQNKDKKAHDNKHRMRLGLFYYSEEEKDVHLEDQKEKE